MGNLKVAQRGLRKFSLPNSWKKLVKPKNDVRGKDQDNVPRHDFYGSDVTYIFCEDDSSQQIEQEILECNVFRVK